MIRRAGERRPPHGTSRQDLEGARAFSSGVRRVGAESTLITVTHACFSALCTRVDANLARHKEVPRCGGCIVGVGHRLHAGLERPRRDHSVVVMVGHAVDGGDDSVARAGGRSRVVRHRVRGVKRSVYGIDGDVRHDIDDDHVRGRIQRRIRARILSRIRRRIRAGVEPRVCAIVVTAPDEARQAQGGGEPETNRTLHDSLLCLRRGQGVTNGGGCATTKGRRRSAEMSSLPRAVGVSLKVALSDVLGALTDALKRSLRREAVTCVLFERSYHTPYFGCACLKI